MQTSLQRRRSASAAATAAVAARIGRSVVQPVVSQAVGIASVVAVVGLSSPERFGRSTVSCRHSAGLRRYRTTILRTAVPAVGDRTGNDGLKRPSDGPPTLGPRRRASYGFRLRTTEWGADITRPRVGVRVGPCNSGTHDTRAAISSYTVGSVAAAPTGLGFRPHPRGLTPPAYTTRSWHEWAVAPLVTNRPLSSRAHVEF